MVTIASRSQMRYEDLGGLPDNGSRYELLDGELAMSPAPFQEHQRAAFRLAIVLAGWCLDRSLEVLPAPVDVILDPQNVVQPDVVVWRPDATLRSGPITSVPLLVVEVLSPATRTRDMTVKREVYARFGIPHYWVVDPAVQAIAAWRLVDGAWDQGVQAGPGEVLSPDGFPGLSITVDSLFA